MPARPFHDASEPTTMCLKNNCSGVAEVKLFQQHENTPKGCVMRWTSIVKACRTEHHAPNHAMTEQRGRNDKATYYLPFLTDLKLICALYGNKTPKNTKKYLLVEQLQPPSFHPLAHRGNACDRNRNWNKACHVRWWGCPFGKMLTYYAEVWGSQRKMNMFN